VSAAQAPPDPLELVELTVLEVPGAPPVPAELDEVAGPMTRSEQAHAKKAPANASAGREASLSCTMPPEVEESAASLE
jgi:hypothetical protein